MMVMAGRKLLVAGAVSMAVGSVVMMSGCEADMSAPTRPRTRNVLAPQNGAQQNAEQREEEAPARPVPQDRGGEFPGQSKSPSKAGASGDAQVATLSSVNLPVTQFKTDFYKGMIPHLPEKPPAHPTIGSIPVAGTGWRVQFWWGENLPMANYPHRDWPVSTTTYQAAQVKHNPTYYWYFQDFVPGANRNVGTFAGDYYSDLYEVPWFYVNTAILPVLMVIQEPFTQVTTERLGADPIYFGYLPPGPIVPSPPPGEIKWEYPFLTNGPQTFNGTGSMAPATTPTPGVETFPGSEMAPIPPTPGLPVVPPPSDQGPGGVMVTPQTNVQSMGTQPTTQP
ncbi:MAG TPA: hypothetical protein VH253_18765 [Phycisphaerae bacterium]|nr:hypothetical protein [Phycisphaerae bacterium]